MDVERWGVKCRGVGGVAGERVVCSKPAPSGPGRPSGTPTRDRGHHPNDGAQGVALLTRHLRRDKLARLLVGVCVCVCVCPWPGMDRCHAGKDGQIRCRVWLKTRARGGAGEISSGALARRRQRVVLALARAARSDHPKLHLGSCMGAMDLAFDGWMRASSHDDFRRFSSADSSSRFEGERSSSWWTLGVHRVSVAASRTRRWNAATPG